MPPPMMSLSAAQIQSLLDQGAITNTQAQSLSASSAPASAPVNSADPLNASVQNDVDTRGGPPPQPQTANDYRPDQSAEQLQRAEGQDQRLSNRAKVYDNSFPGPHLGVPTPQGPNAAPAAAPPKLPDDSLKGKNSLGGVPGSPGVNAQGQPNQNPNDPVSLFLPKQTPGTPFSLAPERKLLGQSLGLAGEGVASLDQQKVDQEKLAEMQAIATDTAGNISMQNTSAAMKAQDENKANWSAAMKRADDASTYIQQKAREIGQRKIDPERYWNSQDKMGQFFSGLSLALGAGGAAITHTPNFALERMENAVKMDVEAQKGDIENAYKSLGIEQDQVHSDLQRAQLSSAFGDKLAMEHWELAKVQGQAMMSKMVAPIDLKKAQIAMGTIDDQIRQSKLSMAQNIYNFESLQRKATAVGPSGPDEKKIREYVTDEKAKFMEKGDNEQDANDRASKLAAERFGLKMSGGQAVLPTLEDPKNKENKLKQEALVVNLPTGEKAEARSESAANEYNKRQMAIGQLASITKRMKAIRDRNHGGTGAFYMNRADLGEARSLQEQAINQYNEITGFNRAPGQPERTGLKGEVIPDVTDYAPSGAVDRKLESLATFVQNAYDLNNNTYLKNPPTKHYDVVQGGTGFAESIGAKEIKP